MLKARLLVTLCCLGGALSTHILMVTLGPTSSHKTPLLALGRGLVSEGHKVTLVSGFPGGPHSPVVEVVPWKLQTAIKSFADRDILSAAMRDERPFSIFDALNYTYKVCEAFYQAPEMSSLLKLDVNLLVVDSVYPDCVLGLVPHFATPFIYVNTVGFYSTHLSLAGNPTMYSVTPFFGSSFSDRMTFIERIVNGVYQIINVGLHMIYNKFFVEPIIRKRFGNDVPSIDFIANNVSLILQNGHYAVTNPRPFLPGVVEIACLQCKEAELLPKELEEFVTGGNENGFIYISFGTSVKSAQIPTVIRSLLAKVAQELPYQVLWKHEEEEEAVSDLPKNMRQQRWLPQQDLLGHPKILAFVNHGGLHGMFEAVFHGVPMVTLPVCLDHFANSRKAAADGYAVELDWSSVTVDSLVAAISEVITDKRYKRKAQQRSILLRDQPEPPLIRALWWVEFVLRHQGAADLHGVARDLTLLEYFMVDSILLIAAIVYVEIWLAKAIWCKLSNINEACRLKTE